MISSVAYLIGVLLLLSALSKISTIGIILFIVLVIIVSGVYYFWEVMPFNPENWGGNNKPKSTIPRSKIISEFNTKVAGVSFGKRQSYLKSIGKKLYREEAKYTEIDLIRDPDNKHDPNAIEVVTEKGQVLGYINSQTAKELAIIMDAGANVQASIIDILGYEDKCGDPTNGPYGCSISIYLFDK
ncbi:HIRAN domain-containing protein [Maridesulfovibrio ferrireducens]|uniref:HIRAN domain-containing protein n=1 Tax=Maridesulfovibrio ferrireducens TaxID=246191 RepID=UPI001A21D269|nr:HIRAN domain-containing protein [Maridesulfovibrio ferrireducens]MBI9110293.1 HIRAN domain-containing protein [Maridesulfovibrio ferrireducens]